jgi:hypothetical protein
MSKIGYIHSLISSFRNSNSVSHENVLTNSKYTFDDGSYLVIGKYVDTNSGWFEFNNKRCNLTQSELVLLREIVALNYGKILYF